MSRPFIVGLTGGIGTGKTTVAEIFRDMGAVIIDADEISRHALDTGTDCYRDTVRTFGRGILNEDDTVNRKELAAIIFRDEAEREKLNAIIHPYVRKTIYSETDAVPPEKTVVWDIPLLIEGGYHKETDALVVVTCPIELRLQRLEKRSGFSREEALSRMRAQMSDEERCREAAFVIENSGSLEELKEKAEAVFRTLQIKKDA